MKNLSTSQLNYLVTTVKTENLQEASQLLHVTPAALSKSIKTLELELGTTLFLRNGRNLNATDLGIYLAQQAQIILDQINTRLYERIKVSAKEKVLRIGSFEVFTTYFLGELVESEKLAKPISILELTPGHLEEALNKKTIDFGITYLPVPHPDLEFIKVAVVSMGIYGLEKNIFTKKKFCEWPFAVPVTPVTGATRVLGLDGWPDSQIPRNRKYQVTLMETALELVRRGKAVAFLPTFIATLHNRNSSKSHQLVKLAAPSIKQTKQGVYLIKRKSTPENSEFRAIARCLRSVCQQS